MATRLIPGAMVCLLPSLALAAVSAPPIPNTPAGHALGAWLDAFNSGDRARIEAFDESHTPWWTVERAMAQRARTGGYELLSINRHDDLWIMLPSERKPARGR